MTSLIRDRDEHLTASTVFRAARRCRFSHAFVPPNPLSDGQDLDRWYIRCRWAVAGYLIDAATYAQASEFPYDAEYLVNVASEALNKSGIPCATATVGKVLREITAYGPIEDWIDPEEVNKLREEIRLGFFEFLEVGGGFSIANPGDRHRHAEIKQGTA